MRTQQTFTINSPKFKLQLLQWSQQFEQVIYLDSNNYHQKYSEYDLLVAVDALTILTTDSDQAFDKLRDYQSVTQDWLFGYLSYDLKNDIESLQSAQNDGLKFPELFFFQPKKILLIKDNSVECHYLKMVDDELELDYNTISAIDVSSEPVQAKKLQLQSRLSKEDYLKKVEQLLAHIHRGDIYEANFCQEFFAKDATILPLAVINHLNLISKAPFSAFLKNQEFYGLSASPERYLKKTGNLVVSQPIKGTSKRSADFTEDQALKQALQSNPKEYSENIMIVDLVRNDLSHTATKGSVTVEELCGIYTFEQVHQMISTVISNVDAATNPIAILKSTFPMGSMTGAPKISAMQLIEKLEVTKRGLYSGAIGYFKPNGDFDFNVVIRTILYNEHERYVSYSVGSAITAKSSAVQEYEECLIKAEAMKRVLEN